MEQNRAACAGKERMEGIRPVVRLEGICKSFGKVRANSNITLDIRPTRIKALLGENGAGKSTLLNIIVGELPADEGTVTLAKGKTLGYLAQHQDMDDARTINETVLEG